MNFLFDIRDRPAERKSQERHACDPAEAPADAVGQEFPVRHAADSGHGRRERADDRNEACQDKRLRSVFIVEFLRSDQMILVKEKRISAAEKLRAKMIPEPITGVIARDSGKSEKRNQNLDLERAFYSGEESGRDEE